MDRGQSHDNARASARPAAEGERRSEPSDRLPSVAARRGQARDIRNAATAVQLTPGDQPGDAAPGDGPRPEGGGAGAVHQRFPRGFPVAIALRPSPTDQAEWRRELAGRTLRQALGDTNRYRGHAAYQALWAQRDEPAGGQPVTSEQISTIVAAKLNNDNVFEREAQAHAANRGSVALGGGEPVMGQHLAFTRQDADPFAQVEAVSAAVGPLGSATPAPDASATEGSAEGESAAEGASAGGGQSNVAELAIFTHGLNGAIDVGRRGHGGWLGLAGLRADIEASLAPTVDIQLYACSTGGGDSSLAEGLTGALAADGHEVTTLAHTNAAHATRNPNARVFSAGPGDARVGSAHINDLAFTAAFVASQVQPTAAALELPPEQTASLGGQLGELMRRWAARERAWQQVMVDGTQAGGDTSGAHASPAALVIGTEPERACRAIRDAWVDGAPGVARGIDSSAVLDPLIGSGPRSRREDQRTASLNQLYAAVFDQDYMRAQAEAIGEALSVQSQGILRGGLVGRGAEARPWLAAAVNVVTVEVTADGETTTRSPLAALGDAREAAIAAVRAAWENGQGNLPSGRAHLRATLLPRYMRPRR